MEADFDEPTKEILSHLEESTECMENVFSDLSTILNVKNNMQKEWDKVDFVHEIDKVIYSLKPSIKEKNIKIELPKMDAFQVKALQPYVYSIFHNIIENAVKYSDISKVNPYVKIELSDTKKYYLASVKDNGMGIDMEMASGKIFQMYQRFNNTHPGQGFGLFLVKSQVEAMGGKVELESNLGQGTSFNLYFRKRN
jgi:signal transduction histidine kinase